MTKLRMGIDLDGCLYDWDDQARFLMKYEFGYDLPPAPHWNYLEEKVTREHWKWLWNEGVERGLFLNGNNYFGGLEAMRELAKIVHVVIITSRPPQARIHTLEWLAHYRIVVDELHILGKSGITGKATMKSTVPCDVYLDDAPHNLQDLLDNTSGRVIGFRRPWNQQAEASPTDFGIIHGLDRLYWAEDWSSIVGLVRGFVDEFKQGPSAGTRRGTDAGDNAS